MQPNCQGRQIIGQWWFLVDGGSCNEEKPSEDILPYVDIHVLEHAHGEDYIPLQMISVRGRKNIEAVLKACLFALGCQDAPIQENVNSLSLAALMILNLLAFYQELTMNKLLSLLRKPEKCVEEDLQELEAHGLIERKKVNDQIMIVKRNLELEIQRHD